MSDFSIFAAEVTRTELGLAPLALNAAPYRVVAEIMGGTQGWNRQSVRSPYVDGEFTVNRSRSQVQEKFGVYVSGATQGLIQSSIATLLAAFSQFRYQLTITLEDASYTWNCDTADYTVDWNQARWLARQALVGLTIPRSPLLVNGGW